MWSNFPDGGAGTKRKQSSVSILFSLLMLMATKNLVNLLCTQLTKLSHSAIVSDSNTLVESTITFDGDWLSIIRHNPTHWKLPLEEYRLGDAPKAIFELIYIPLCWRQSWIHTCSEIQQSCFQSLYLYNNLEIGMMCPWCIRSLEVVTSSFEVHFYIWISMFGQIDAKSRTDVFNFGNEYERKSMIRHSKWDALTVFLPPFKFDISILLLCTKSRWSS